jgi:hypothetical protein
MSTRSHIGIVNADGTVSAVYCHWDGYPEHNGKVLLNSYMAEDKVRALIALGDVSVLDDDIGEKHDFDGDRPKGMSTFYGRDREEPWNDVKPGTYKDVEEFLSKCQEDYTYLYDKGEWMFRSWKRELEPLTQEVCV